MFQVYSFLERNLCDQAHTPSEVISLFTRLTECKPNIRGRAKPYCATINTAFDGRANQLVKTVIETLVAKGYLANEDWQRLPGYSLNGYQLAIRSEGPSH
jgi:hypothetical protein